MNLVIFFLMGLFFWAMSFVFVIYVIRKISREAFDTSLFITIIASVHGMGILAVLISYKYGDAEMFSYVFGYVAGLLYYILRKPIDERFKG